MKRLGGNSGVGAVSSDDIGKGVWYCIYLCVRNVLKMWYIFVCQKCLEDVIKHRIAIFNNLNQSGDINLIYWANRQMDGICIEKFKSRLDKREEFYNQIIQIKRCFFFLTEMKK